MTPTPAPAASLSRLDHMIAALKQMQPCLSTINHVAIHQQLHTELVEFLSLLSLSHFATERKSPFPRANGPVNYKCDTDTHVLFYEQDFYVLSNFSAFNVSFGIDPYLVRRFQTSEHAYHFQKFVFPGAGGMSINARSDITNATSAHEAFKAAERLKQFRNPDWDAVKVDIMRDILRAKVDQHEYVRRKLLATGDRILIEDSWRDDFWGWGQNMDGQNMLGKLWMEVRAELRATAPQPPAEGQ